MTRSAGSGRRGMACRGSWETSRRQVNDHLKGAGPRAPVAENPPHHCPNLPCGDLVQGRDEGFPLSDHPQPRYALPVDKSARAEPGMCGISSIPDRVVRET